MTAPQHPTSGGAATTTDYDHAKKVLALRAAGLQTVRSSAAKWQAGLSGLLGGVVGAVGIGLRESLAKVDLAWAIAVAIILVAAFVFAFVSLYFALHAAGGAPKLVRTGGRVDDDGHIAAVSAIGQLRTARWLTAVAIAAFLIAMGTTWFAPARVDLASVSTATVQSCGAVEVSGGNLIVTDADGFVNVLKIDDVTTWQKVTSCAR